MTIRVLVVDDSVVVRRVVSRVLEEDPELTVCGFASNGRLGLRRVEHDVPDLVVLDLEMPEMDGLAFLRALQRRVPVIVFSALSKRGAVATLDALALGALDYVTKPARFADAEEAREAIRRELVPRVKALAGRRAAPAAPAAHPPPGPAPTARIVAIGASTGGPEALGQLLGALPAAFPAPVLVVQHMPATFTPLLAARLDRGCALAVVEASDGAVPAAGTVHLAPGGRHLVFADDRLALTDDPPEAGARPALDPLLRTLAPAFLAGTLAVVLTGMGSDGLAGARAVRAAGGRVLIQDRKSSVVWGMPGVVARAGLADAARPPAELAAELVRRVSARPPG